MAEVDSTVNVRFEGDLQQALEESLFSFPVMQLKAEQRFIIEKIGGRRDVFPRSIDVVAWPVQRKFSRCRKVQKSCNEHKVR